MALHRNLLVGLEATIAGAGSSFGGTESLVRFRDMPAENPAQFDPCHTGRVSSVQAARPFRRLLYLTVAQARRTVTKVGTMMTWKGKRLGEKTVMITWWVRQAASSSNSQHIPSSSSEELTTAARAD